ncbi:DUF368 domain-containing protein [Velocimicrobium porci]|uniref:DUF368 domain-containing protein n=1 Tax=Velocimicrobium porci TaxID=2606634 RepID=A0A6L5XWE7_9FIRM|nr:DUF368 domain-containing protein [Velocimicrobium porci]MSS62678.1 DUF368 domain-containing protein [Velocimicrobium porci]
MKYLINIIKGVLIGIANAIPGVSGGTMMVSMGIYDEIIGCVTNLFSQLKKSIITLIPYIIGMGLGIVGLSYGIKYLLANFPLQTSMIFIGLILGGIPVLAEHVKGKKMGISNGIIFVIFFAMIIVLQMLGGTEATQTTIEPSVLEGIKLFFIGIIAAATMVVPGVSGSMILMLMGYYYPIINTITAFVDGLRAGDIQVMLAACGILIPFGIGVVVGIFVIAKIIELLLANYESHTYCAILGLVLASPFAILIGNGIPALSPIIVISSIITFAVGFAVAFFLGRE